MTPRKKQKTAADGVASSETTDGNKEPITCTTFWTLPEELRGPIIRSACSRSLPADDDDMGAHSRGSIDEWRLSLDLKTVRNLTLVSKQFYNLLNPVLWAHIRITRPSALTQLHAALLSRPSNGLLVKSLHLGPLDDVAGCWWPARTMGYVFSDEDDDDEEEEKESWEGDELVLTFKTGLTEKEKNLRPSWCRGDHGFQYLEYSCEPHERAVSGAIQSAMRSIGIDSSLRSNLWDERRNFIGIVEWTRRIYAVQGALDLFLSRMRQLDDDARSKSKNAMVYPRLVVAGFEDRSEAAKGKERAGATASEGVKKSTGRQTKESQPGNVFIVTRDQIQAHLLRPGAHSDHFDHPLFFARDGIRYLAFGTWGEVVVDRDRVEKNTYVPDTTEKYRSESSRPWRDGAPVLGRFILEHTPHVKNLSLTGLFHQLLADDRPRPPLALPKVIALSIGPLTPPSEAAICLWEDMSFPAMEKLRVCGATPGITPACLVAGEMDGFPKLKEVHWDCGHKDKRFAGHRTMVCKHLNIMRGADETAEPDPDSMRKRNTRHGVYVEARLHPRYVSAFLDQASTPQIRNALIEGLPADDALHRLRVVESRAPKTVSAENLDFALQKYDVLREEGQQWWRDCALEVERRERQAVGS